MQVLLEALKPSRVQAQDWSFGMERGREVG
jgi:hypothetical protein